MPVVAPTSAPTGYLSRLDPSLVTHIVSFVGTSRELLNVALTCKSFGWQQPGSGLDWSLAEEAARGTVRSGQNDVEGARITLPPYVKGTTTWLTILRGSEQPLKFDTLLGPGIEHANERRTSIRGGHDVSSAVASICVMVSGIHCAEFHIVGGEPNIGIVRPIPNLDPERYANGFFSFFNPLFHDVFLAARTYEWGSSNVHLCQYITIDGKMSWSNWAGGGAVIGWEQWEGMESCQSGDTVCMLLNLDRGTLTVYKNNRRLGVMKDGLTGSYSWCTTLGRRDAVTIRNGDPPTA